MGSGDGDALHRLHEHTQHMAPLHDGDPPAPGLSDLRVSDGNGRGDDDQVGLRG